ncbi:hypothetical protein AC578_1789 [Pseudocercospora eumusae]|uniref:Uncharacterized protein n=1 Tax=Pseudocercospora eumusae TaxID=321146 RepID=A0A139GWP1_9PEZI|nr:hypothetical protein AC578_1789 [Pseudocercospora eumusae]
MPRMYLDIYYAEFVNLMSLGPAKLENWELALLPAIVIEDWRRCMDVFYHRTGPAMSYHDQLTNDGGAASRVIDNTRIGCSDKSLRLGNNQKVETVLDHAKASTPSRVSHPALGSSFQHVDHVNHQPYACETDLVPTYLMKQYITSEIAARLSRQRRMKKRQYHMAESYGAKLIAEFNPRISAQKMYVKGKEILEERLRHGFPGQASCRPFRSDSDSDSDSDFSCRAECRSGF